jgi:hypothetical protein
MQREFETSASGSLPSFAAPSAKVRNGPEADLPTRPAFGASHKSSL